MTSRERVLAAMDLKIPDRIPSLEFAVDRALATKLLGWEEGTGQGANLEKNAFTLQEAIEVAAFLRHDNLAYVLRAPVYADKHAGKDGRLFYGAGQISSREAMAAIELPDPNDDALYEEAAEFAANKGDYAACFVTRAGIFPALLSMGIERFSLAFYEDREFLEDMLDLFFDWSVTVAAKACTLGFDLYVSTDDMAFKSAPYFSPALFREIVVPRYQRLAKQITLPWIVHSDGNIVPFLDDLISVGIRGLHPLEKGAVDILEVKKTYGDRICCLGNVDLNLLAGATPKEVEDEVRWLVKNVGPGGGYIMTSGNSLAAYCIPENVLAMRDTLQACGVYPV